MIASLNIVAKMFARLLAKIFAKGRRLILILHLEAKYAKMNYKNEIYAKKLGEEHLDYKSQLWQKKSTINSSQSQLWKSTVNAFKSMDDVSKLTGR